MRPKTFVLALTALLAVVPAARAGVIYSSDFDSALGSEWSGETSITGIQSFGSLGGFSGSMLRNASTGNPATKSTLTLTGLESHSTISLDFLLAVIDSWDGSAGSPAPDAFVVRIGDGTSMTTVFNQTFAISSGSGSYTGPSLSGKSNSSSQTRSNYGFSSNFSDEGYDLGDAAAGLVDLAHTSSTLVVEFYAAGSGWQGGTDESWGIDNLSISSNAGVEVAVAPLPSASLLGLAGFGVLGLLRLRRRRRA